MRLRGITGMACLLVSIDLTVGAELLVQSGPTQEQPVETGQQEAWGTPVFGVRCSVRPDATGGGHRFHLCTRNGADAARYVESHGGLLAIMKIKVVGPDGKEPPLTKVGANMKLIGYDVASARTVIDPGVQRCRPVDLGAMYKLDRPGRYEFSFSRSVFLSEFGSKGTPTSNTLVFDVGSSRAVETPKP